MIYNINTVLNHKVGYTKGNLFWSSPYILLEMLSFGAP